MGEFEATRWVVTITKQGGTPPETYEKEASLAGREHAYLTFTGLSEGRWDTTLRLFGIRHGKKGSILATLSPSTAIDVEPRLLDFGATKTSLTVHVDATSPPGVDDVAWTASTATAWLSVSPESGTGSGDITVTVDREGLSAGIYTDGAIALTSGGSPMNVDAAMEVSGPKIVFQSFEIAAGAEQAALFTMGLAGDNIAPITDNTGGQMWSYPEWSPDGDLIACVRNVTGQRPDVVTIAPDGSGLSNVTNTPDSWEGWPARWSPDGTRLVFVRRYPGDDIYDIRTIGVGGTDEHLLRSQDGGGDSPAWSADGAFIYYWHWWTQTTRRISSADGSGEVVVVTGGSAPLPSPDGQWIAVSQGASGIARVDTAGANLLTLTTEQGTPCSWAPDGSELLYVVELPGGNSDIRAVTTDGSGTVRHLTDTAGSAEPWASWRP